MNQMRDAARQLAWFCQSECDSYNFAETHSHYFAKVRSYNLQWSTDPEKPTT
jgi:hypothetical protein